MEVNMRLIYGDCLEEMDKLKLDNSMCIVTDPPFNIKYHYSIYKDNKIESDYLDWLDSIVNRGIPFVIVHYPEMLHKFSIKVGSPPTKIVSWVYNSNTAKQHRDIAFYNVKPNFNQVKQPYKNPKDKRIKARIARGILGCRLYDWWDVNQVKNVSKTKNEIIHPCIMPNKVMANIIGILPKEYTTIIDPFMGSGSTGVVCKKLHRDFIGIELDDKYFKIAQKRINNLDIQGELL